MLMDISLFLCTEVVHLVGAMSAEDGKLLVYKALSRRRSRSESRDESSCESTEGSVQVSPDVSSKRCPRGGNSSVNKHQTEGELT